MWAQQRQRRCAQDAVAIRVQDVEEPVDLGGVHLRAVTLGARLGCAAANWQHFSEFAIFGGLVLGCIETKFCRKIIQNMRFAAFFKLYKICILFAPLQAQDFSKRSV